MEDDGVLDVVAQGQPYPSSGISILNGPGSMGRVLLICVRARPGAEPGETRIRVDPRDRAPFVGLDL